MGRVTLLVAFNLWLARMLMPARPSHTPLWSASFRFPQPMLLWARATLFADWLELTGWGLHGRYRRVIRLQRLQHVDARAPDMLVLWQTGGTALRLRMADAAAWKQRIERQRAILHSSTRRS